MSEELKLQTNHRPSFFNKDTLLGGLIGFSASAFIPGGLIVAGLVVAGSSAVGGYLGKQRQERENREGKTVGEASIWNKDTLIGGWIGNDIGWFIGAVAATAIVIAGFAAAGIDASAVAGEGYKAVAETFMEKAPAYGFGAAATFLTSWLGGTAIGAYIGGSAGKARMGRELEEAKQQTIVAHLSQTVSPEVGKAMEYTMEHNKDWGKQVAQDRLLAEAMQQGR